MIKNKLSGIGRTRGSSRSPGHDLGQVSSRRGPGGYFPKGLGDRGGTSEAPRPARSALRHRGMPCCVNGQRWARVSVVDGVRWRQAFSVSRWQRARLRFPALYGSGLDTSLSCWSGSPSSRSPGSYSDAGTWPSHSRRSASAADRLPCCRARRAAHAGQEPSCLMSRVRWLCLGGSSIQPPYPRGSSRSSTKTQRRQGVSGGLRTCPDPVLSELRPEAPPRSTRLGGDALTSQRWSPGPGTLR